MVRRRNKEKGGVCGKKIQKTRLSSSISFFVVVLSGGRSENTFQKSFRAAPACKA
jgi:hypothetical protein